MKWMKDGRNYKCGAWRIVYRGNIQGLPLYTCWRGNEVIGEVYYVRNAKQRCHDERMRRMEEPNDVSGMGRLTNEM